MALCKNILDTDTDSHGFGSNLRGLVEPDLGVCVESSRWKGAWIFSCGQ